MSDGMAFLTGAAFAGVAVLFMLKGGGNIGAAITPSPQPLPYSQTNPVNPINRPVRPILIIPMGQHRRHRIRRRHRFSFLQ
jgi:hypothetical protein